MVVSELSPPNQAEKIKEIIRQKAWYGLDPQTGAFSWVESVKKLAEELDFPPKVVKQVIEDAFTPACLSQIRITENDQQIQLPLLAGLEKLGLTMIVWTVGDINWQITKFTRSGANQYINSQNFCCFSANKIEGLKNILNSLVEQDVLNTTTHVLIVDDKEEMISKAMSLTKTFKARGLVLYNYHMKLGDTAADAQHFYNFVVDLMQKLSQQKLILILDFDGVIADTDAVLFGPVCEKLAQILTNPTLA